MKKRFYLLSLLILPFVTANGQAPIVVSMYGTNPAASEQTTTYSTDIPGGNFIIWSVSGGTITGTSSSSVLTSSNSISVTWNSVACGTNGAGSINAYKFSTWPPSSSPSHVSSMGITIQGPVCSPSQPSCQGYANAIESIWNNPYIPQQNKCSIVRSIYNSAIGSGLQDTSCLNLHGCP